MSRSIPGSGRWAGTRPLLAPKVAQRTPRLHPGAGRASSASSPRARGTRAAGGTWGLSCNASSSKSLSTAGMVPRGEPGAGWKHGGRMARQSRVLQAQATSVCSVPWVAPRAHAWPVAVAVRPPALLSAQPSAEQDQQEVWRAADAATGSVAAPLPPAPFSRGKPHTPPGRREPVECEGRWEGAGA